MRIRVSDLAPGQQYALQFRAVSGDEFSDWSQKLVVNTDLDPTAPANVTGVNLVADGTAFVATWNPVTTNADGSPILDFDHYKVIISDGVTSVEKHTTVPSFNILYEDNNAWFGTPKATLIIDVYAVDTTGNSSAIAGTDTESNPAPAAPVLETPVAYSDSVVFKWTASTSDDVVAYRLHMGTTAGFTASAANLVWAGAATTATYFSSDTTTDRYFKLFAVDVFGTLSTAVSAGPIKPLGITGGVDDIPPTNPTGVIASAAANADPSGQFVDLTVSWTGPTPAADSSLSHFNVRYGTGGTWNYVQVPRDELSVKISKILAGGSVDVQVQAVDYTANDSAWVSANSGAAVSLPKDTAFTETPAAPTAAVGTMRIQVSHTLLASPSGSLPSDLDYFEVYASTTTGFTPDTTNMLGTMKVNVVAVQTFDIPASGSSGTTQTWYVKVRAVDRAGNKSPYSAQATASVSLIATANIGDAQITNAKINDLAANKITAGTGIINDLTIKSKLTLGDVSTLGAIETYGYIAGTTGARFDKNLIEINNGSIYSGALVVRNSKNLLPPDYAGFEYSGGFIDESNTYTVTPTTGVTHQIITNPSVAVAESNYLNVQWNNPGANFFIWLAPTDSTNNIVLPGSSANVTVSAWFKNVEAGAQTVFLKVKTDDGLTFRSGAQSIPTGGAWVRREYTFSITSTSALASMAIEIQPGTAGSLSIDAVQFELASAATAWAPGGFTGISGNKIETYAIDANHLRANAIKARHIDAKQVTSEHLESDMVISERILTAPVGQARWQVGPEGMAMYDSGNQAYINFPTAGNPTFTGDVNAGGLTVTGTTKLAESQLAVGKAMTLNLVTSAPATAPTLTGNYDKWSFAVADTSTQAFVGTNFGTPVSPNLTNVTGIHVDATEVLVMEHKFTTDFSHVGGWLWVYSRTPNSAGKLPCLRVVEIHFSDHFRCVGIAKIGTRYFTIYDSTPVKLYEIYPWNAAPMNNASSRLVTAQPYVEALGVDFGSPMSNADKLVMAWAVNIGQTSGRFDSQTITLDTWATSSVIQTSSSTAWFGLTLKGAVKGAFDYGSDRLLVAPKNTSITSVQPFTTATTPYPYATNDGFPVANTNSYEKSGLAYDGSNFFTLATDGSLVRYSNFNWSTGDSTIWAAVKWRNTLGNYETSLGAKASLIIKKRQYINITHPLVPSDNDPVVPNDEPDSMGVYVVRTATQPASDASYIWQANTARFVGTYRISDPPLTSGSAPATPGFPQSTPSSIKSSGLGGDGLPLLDLRADGYAKMNQLIVTSGTDADRSPNNAPALRIGDINGVHMRIDGNEILAMLSNTQDDQGALTLNQSKQDGTGVSIAGGVRLSRGSLIRNFKVGVDTKTTNANGEVFLPHGMGETPTMALVTPQNSNMHASVTSLGPTNIVAVIRNISTGALDTSNSRLCYFMAAVTD